MWEKYSRDKDSENDHVKDKLLMNNFLVVLEKEETISRRITSSDVWKSCKDYGNDHSEDKALMKYRKDNIHKEKISGRETISNKYCTQQRIL